MDSLLEFFAQHGLWLTLIAVVGIVVLGVLKYTGAFKKLSENARHICYLAISVGLSIIGSIIYTLCVGAFDWKEMFVLAGAILALNQTFYSLYANLTLKELWEEFIKWAKEYFQKSNESKDQE